MGKVFGGIKKIAGGVGNFVKSGAGIGGFAGGLIGGGVGSVVGMAGGAIGDISAKRNSQQAAIDKAIKKQEAQAKKALQAVKAEGINNTARTAQAVNSARVRAGAQARSGQAYVPFGQGGSTTLGG